MKVAQGMVQPNGVAYRPAEDALYIAEVETRAQEQVVIQSFSNKLEEILNGVVGWFSGWQGK